MTGTVDIDALIKQCRSQDADDRESAVRTLKDVGQARIELVGPALAALLSDPDASVRKEATEALGCLHHASARLDLERVLRSDEDWMVRASAAEALGDIGDAHALGTLQAALADEVAPVRSYAALAIGLCGDESALAVVQKALAAESDARTRCELLVATVRLGDARAFDELLAFAVGVTEDAVHGLLNAIEDLLSRRTPDVVVTRAAELGARLATLGHSWDVARAHTARLRDRLAELGRGAPA